MPRCKLLQRDVKSEKVIANTVRGGGRASMTDKHNWDTCKVGSRIRRLTPTECERLQGFPDGWTASVSDSQRYKCLGNAVTVNVIEAIFKKLEAV
jgi:site-specific DNA-cytosine methylase